MALELFFYREAVELEEIKELVLRAVISDLDSYDTSALVRALLKAYWEIAEVMEDEGAPEIKALDGREFEDFYRKVYVKAFEKRIPGYLDKEDPDITWPEPVPYYESGSGYVSYKLFPVWFAKTVALATVERDVAMLKEMQRYAEAVETPGTPEHEDLKARYGEERAAEMVARGKERRAAEAGAQ